MANLRLHNATRSAEATAIRDRIDAGTGPGKIQIRSGTQPATPQDAATGTLLAELTFADPCGTVDSAGVLTFDTDPDLTTTGAAAGTATWARMLDSDNNVVADCDVGTTDATLILNTTAISVGVTVTITAGTITIPMG